MEAAGLDVPRSVHAVHGLHLRGRSTTRWWQGKTRKRDNGPLPLRLDPARIRRPPLCRCSQVPEVRYSFRDLRKDIQERDTFQLNRWFALWYANSHSFGLRLFGTNQFAPSSLRCERI